MPAETYYIWKAVVLHFVINRAAQEAYADARRANQFVAMGQFDRAIADYSKAIRKVPNVVAPHLRAEYYNSRAWAYFKAGKAAQGLPGSGRRLNCSPTMLGHSIRDEAFLKHLVGANRPLRISVAHCHWEQTTLRCKRPARTL